MKYIIIVGDGMADYPLPELEEKTPLEVAKTPNMDWLASKGEVGMARTIPPKMTPASDVGNLSILGYDPRQYYCGRAPLEAANMGIELAPDEVAFRCNLITADKDILVDYSAGHISSQEAKVLINSLNEEMGREGIRFYAGVSYRHLLILKTTKYSAKTLAAIECTPPHDLTGKNFRKSLPKGEGADLLIELMEKGRKVLKDHEINRVRVDLGENPATMIWLWGQGQAPRIPSFKEKYGLTGGVISAVDLINGIGRIIGFEVIKVPGATGYYDTNYEGKAEYALEALKTKDLVLVHIEAADEAGHNGDLREKMSAIEKIDRLVIGKIMEGLKGVEHRILVMPDHPTAVAQKTHTADEVPFVIAGTGVASNGAPSYSEAAGKATGLFLEEGYRVMERLVSKTPRPQSTVHSP